MLQKDQDADRYLSLANSLGNESNVRVKPTELRADEIDRPVERAELPLRPTKSQ